MATIRVRVPLVVEVDRERWAEEWGCDATTKAVVEDVRSYVLNAAQTLSGVEDTGATVELAR